MWLELEVGLYVAIESSWKPYKTELIKIETETVIYYLDDHFFVTIAELSVFFVYKNTLLTKMHFITI